MRENYTGTKDPNFTIDLNIDISNYKKDKSEGNNNYTLKSCISYSTFGFFTDCYVKRDNMEGAWYRYMDRQQIDSNPNILFEFQPVLLFYEIFIQLFVAFNNIKMLLNLSHKISVCLFSAKKQGFLLLHTTTSIFYFSTNLTIAQ